MEDAELLSYLPFFFFFFFLAILQEAPKDSKQEQPEKKEEPKFQAFTGKKYSLRG